MWTATQFLMSHGEKGLPGRGAARTQAWGSRGSGCLWLVVGRPQILPGFLRILWDAVNLRVWEGGVRLSQPQRATSAGAGPVAPGGEAG